MVSFEKVRLKALELGFDFAGVARAEALDNEARRLEQWLAGGFHGEMSYMENHFDLRTDPRKLLPGTRSVIVLSHNYYAEQNGTSEAKIARYAYGQDYHKVLRKKCKALERWMKEAYGDILFRAFIDSGPVMEREWANRAGLGWNGRNTLNIRPGVGSYFFLTCVLTDLVFEYANPLRDYCGSCTRCIEACPTEAISPSGYLLDASRCISYLTIELRKEIPEEYRKKMEGWVFGCDICQEVCPWNRFAKPHSEPAFTPSPALLNMTAYDWSQISEKLWDVISRGSPLRRTGRVGMQRNGTFLLKSQSKDEQSDSTRLP